MENEVCITVPEGMEIDKENSTFECIKFKKKEPTTYEDIVKNQMKNGHYFITDLGNISYIGDCAFTNCREYNNISASKKQLEKLLAINKLMNVAKYLCPCYKGEIDKSSWSIYICRLDNSIQVTKVFHANYLDVFFPSKELAQQAIDILGEDTIRLALSTDW